MADDNEHYTGCLCTRCQPEPPDHCECGKVATAWGPDGVPYCAAHYAMLIGEGRP